MDPTADNYDVTALYDDGSCAYGGCTDPTADNYDATATYDDGSCVFCNALTTQTFDYTGSMETFTVPAGVTSVTIEVKGAEGVGQNGFSAGQGGGAMGDLAVNPGDVLNIFVGGSDG